MATRYDRVIPPGGQGSVTLGVDTNEVLGEFEKHAVVWLGGQEADRLVLTLRGQVRAYVSFDPGAYVSLWGKVGQRAKDEVVLTNHSPTPLRILEATTDLGERVRWELITEEEGRVFRLRVEDRSGRPGDYSGHLRLQTNLPQKPVLTVLVNGSIEGPQGQ